MHSNVMHRFLVQAFQDPPFCSSTVYTTRTELHLDMPEDARTGRGCLAWQLHLPVETDMKDIGIVKSVKTSAC